eukprot:TRINITY_DN16591_c0_g4_i1.p1 TRINITY_DN16591_c0_g4~~TRINITY_DN16591_c0_g4_i1.p1  ORF type:complete len:991 (+),score=46.31 TRINITY_DN16591_c0_g4_i1:91-3063(+)
MALWSGVDRQKEEKCPHRTRTWTPEIILIALLVCFRGVDGACLPDPVEASGLIEVDGVMMPLGIWMLTWDSASLVANVVRIIAEEVLGLQVNMGPGNQMASSSPTAIRALAGCRITNDTVEECFNNNLHAVDRRYHLAFETWSAYSHWLKWEASGSDRRPVLLGHMGYLGSSGPHIKKSTDSASVSRNGLSLLFYRNYNITCFDRSASFASIDDFDPSLLQNCSDMRRASDVYLPSYAQHFDYDDGFGFQRNSDGSYSLICHAGLWWLSPSCRANLGNCVPYLTNEHANGMQEIMMKSSYCDLPVALAFASPSAQLADILEQHDIMLHTWQPNILSVETQLTPVVFPDYNATLALQGFYVTRLADRELHKWTMRGFEDHAVPSVYVARRMNFTNGDINMMLSCVAAGQSHYQAACNWLKSGASDWRKDWLPSCPRGEIANLTGTPRPGSSQTRVECLPCQAGRFRNDIRENSCSVCPAGRFSRAGSAACQKCWKGSYASLHGSQTCQTCAWWYTTSAGAEDSEDCLLDPLKLAAIFAGTLLSLPVLIGLLVRCQNKRTRQMERVQGVLTRGLEAIDELKHPMCVVKLTDFCAMSLEEVRQECHEVARDAGKVIFLDTLRAIDKFRAAGSKILFFSYTWNSWYKLGPDVVQLDCMKKAACKLCELCTEDVSCMFIWLDVMAIPQINPNCKAQAIDSLFIYASMVDYFIAICPEGTHEDSHEPAGPEAYKSRVWCRIEQVAHCSVNGFRNMYHCLGPEHLEPIRENWLDEIIHIFEANMTCCRRRHPDNIPCDRELLVPTLLAMYAVLFQRLKWVEQGGHEGTHKTASRRSLEAVWSCMNADVNRTFPPTYIYRKSDGTQEKRLLFGGAVSCLHDLAKKPSGLAPVTSMLSSSPLRLRGWSMGSRVSRVSLPSEVQGRVSVLISMCTAATSCEDGGRLIGCEALPTTTNTHRAPLPDLPPVPPPLHLDPSPSEDFLQATRMSTLTTGLKRSI